MRRILSVLMWLVVPCWGQQDLERRANELKALASRPPAEWDDAHALKVSQLYLDLYLDMLWDPEQYRLVSGYLPRSRPRVSVYIANQLNTPSWEGGVMRVPMEYMLRLHNVGLLAGHDVYVEEETINLPNPLLSGAFRKSRVFPLLLPLRHYFDDQNLNFAQLAVYLTCPAQEAGCQTAQQMAVMAAQLFAIVHELSHGFLQHKEGEPFDIAQEKAADANAAKVLAVLAGEFRTMPKDMLEVVQKAFRLTPLLWLEVEAGAARSEPVRSDYRERGKALAAALGPERRKEAEEYLEGDRRAEGPTPCKIVWTETPARLWIDGLAVSPREVEAKTLLLGPESHTVVASRPGSLAIARIRSGDETVNLTFRAMPSVPPPAELDVLRKQRKWAAILAMTSDESIQPRDPAVTVYHLEALRFLGLARLMREPDWATIPEAMRRRVQVWLRLRQPLSTWQ